jgi:NAD(P)-dependent dehydrogenase (short-subunit alcohol dehydrogenase family)
MKSTPAPDNLLIGYQLAGYNTSKAALNHYTIVIASDFKEARVNAITPGYVATNLNGYSGFMPIEKSVEGIIKHAVLLDKESNTGVLIWVL